MFKKLVISLIFTIFFLLNLHSKEIILHVPIIEGSPKQHLFYHELLQTSLEEAGHEVVLIKKLLSYQRLRNSFDSGKISLNWLLESKDRNNKYIPIKVGLTNNLIGKRVLFIKKDKQYLFNNVTTLEEFRDLNLVGAMGEGWFDVKVWKENNLKVKEHGGNWKYIYDVLAYQDRYDYFSRGFNEIVLESKEHSLLDIEKKLLLIYDRDFVFYLSKKGPNSGAKYKNEIQKALEKAKKSGLIKRLVRKYWASDFKSLDYDNRIKIYLKTPK